MFLPRNHFTFQIIQNFNSFDLSISSFCRIPHIFFPFSIFPWINKNSVWIRFQKCTCMHGMHCLLDSISLWSASAFKNKFSEMLNICVLLHFYLCAFNQPSEIRKIYMSYSSYRFHRPNYLFESWLQSRSHYETHKMGKTIRRICNWFKSVLKCFWPLLGLWLISALDRCNWQIKRLTHLKIDEKKFSQ